MARAGSLAMHARNAYPCRKYGYRAKVAWARISELEPCRPGETTAVLWQIKKPCRESLRPTRALPGKKRAEVHLSLWGRIYAGPADQQSLPPGLRGSNRDIVGDGKHSRILQPLAVGQIHAKLNEPHLRHDAPVWLAPVVQALEPHNLPGLEKVGLCQSVGAHLDQVSRLIARLACGAGGTDFQAGAERGGAEEPACCAAHSTASRSPGVRQLGPGSWGRGAGTHLSWCRTEGTTSR